MRAWPKKCPHCGSSRVVTTEHTFHCQKCDYRNRDLKQSEVR